MKHIKALITSWLIGVTVFLGVNFNGIFPFHQEQNNQQRTSAANNFDFLDAPMIYSPLILAGDPHLKRWETLPRSTLDGGIMDAPGFLPDAKIEIAPDGQPVVVWTYGSFTSVREIYVRRWNGQDWVEISPGSASGGGISNTGGGSSEPALAIAPDGSIYVTWVYRTTLGLERLYLRKWDGQAWVEVGPHSASVTGIRELSSGGSGLPCLAISPDGYPYLAWVDSTNTTNIYMLRWDGSAWVEVGAGSASGEGLSAGGVFWNFSPDIGFAPDGTLYLVWQTSVYYGNGEIFAKLWNGENWLEVGTGSASGGGISNTYGDSLDPDLAVSSDGTPYVVWEDQGDGYSQYYIYVRRWNNAMWEEVGVGSASQTGLTQDNAYDPRIAISPEGLPLVAYGEVSEDNIRAVHVRKWENGSWHLLGEDPGSPAAISFGYGAFPQIAVDPTDSPYILWQELISESPDGGYQLLAKIYR